MLTYSTKTGDMADLIAYQHYGTTSARVVEQLLEANPGLADHGPILQAGLIVTLPDIDTAATTQGLKLWD